MKTYGDSKLKINTIFPGSSEEGAGKLQAASLRLLICVFPFSQKDGCWWRWVVWYQYGWYARLPGAEYEAVPAGVRRGQGCPRWPHDDDDDDDDGADGGGGGYAMVTHILKAGVLGVQTPQTILTSAYQNTEYANQNTKYVNQNNKYTKQNTKYATQYAKYANQNTKYAN